MPFDTKRINGPEVSFDYKKFIKDRKAKNAEKYRREKDRKNDDEHRKIFLKTGTITKAKGSAYIEQGQTKVICAVYGPREIPKRSDFSMKGILNCTFEHTPYAKSVRKAPGIMNSDGGEAEELSILLGQALEATVCMHLYPKSQIDVFVTVIEDDGSTLAAAITASGLALADASIQMFDTLVGASIKRVKNRVFIDPDKTEEEMYDETECGQMTIGFQPSLEQVALVSQEGHVNLESLTKDTKQLSKMCTELMPIVHSCLVQAIKESDTS